MASQSTVASVQKRRVNIFLHQTCKGSMLLLIFMVLIVRTKNLETSLMDKP